MTTIVSHTDHADFSRLYDQRGSGQRPVLQGPVLDHGTITKKFSPNCGWYLTDSRKRATEPWLRHLSRCGVTFVEIEDLDGYRSQHSVTELLDR